MLIIAVKSIDTVPIFCFIFATATSREVNSVVTLDLKDILGWANIPLLYPRIYIANQ